MKQSCPPLKVPSDIVDPRMVPGYSNLGDYLPDDVLGNAVISKNFLRTRKIMVMHSNEGESVVYVPTQTDCGSDHTT